MNAHPVFATLAAAFQAVTLVILPIELWRLRRAGQLTKGRLLEMAGSASTLVPLLLATLLLDRVIAPLQGLLAHLSTQLAPSPWSVALCLLLVDLLYYWDHRLGHEVRLFWALGHSVHHSSRVYDQSTALRVSALDGPFTAWVYIPALLVFPAGLVVGCLGIVVAYQTWLHTECVGKLAWLDPWLNTPSNHRVHHASQARYIDKNYGGVLVVWDRLFGTYEPESEPPVYGLTTPLESSNPVAIHTFELQRLARDLRGRTWSERWAELWRRPN